MSMNADRVKQNLFKQLKRKGLLKPIAIYRNEVNEFHEPTEPVKVCDIEAHYHKGKNNNLNINITEGSSVVVNRSEKLLVVNNEESLLIKTGDFFHLNDTKYEIVDKGDNFEIVFDMTLERV